MSFFELILYLFIASVCGSLGARIAGSSHLGCFGSIALGFIGSLVGQYAARALALPELFTVHLDGRSFPVVWSIVGSAVFVAVLTLLTGRRGRD